MDISRRNFLKHFAIGAAVAVATPALSAMAEQPILTNGLARVPATVGVYISKNETFIPRKAADILRERTIQIPATVQLSPAASQSDAYAQFQVYQRSQNITGF